MGDQLFRHFPEDSEEEEADQCLSWDTIKEGSLKRKSLKHNGVAVSVCALPCRVGRTDHSNYSLE